jgi:hypothetical protein
MAPGARRRSKRPAPQSSCLGKTFPERKHDRKINGRDIWPSHAPVYSVVADYAVKFDVERPGDVAEYRWHVRNRCVQDDLTPAGDRIAVHLVVANVIVHAVAAEESFRFENYYARSVERRDAKMNDVKPLYSIHGCASSVSRAGSPGQACAPLRSLRDSLERCDQLCFRGFIEIAPPSCVDGRARHTLLQQLWNGCPA